MPVTPKTRFPVASITKAFTGIGTLLASSSGKLALDAPIQAYVPEFQVRWRWKPNSVAFWDNRSTQHYAVMDYPPCHRKMERAGIVGDKPF